MQRREAAGVADRADALVGGDGHVDAAPEPGEVVEGGDGLLDELEAVRREPGDHRRRRVEVPRAVGVDAERHRGADRVAHRSHEVEVVARVHPADLHLDGGKARQCAGIDRTVVHERVDRHHVAEGDRPTVTRRLLRGPP